VDRRLPDKSLDASSTLDFGKKDGRAARGTGIRLSPTFCKQNSGCEYDFFSSHAKIVPIVMMENEYFSAINKINHCSITRVIRA